MHTPQHSRGKVFLIYWSEMYNWSSNFWKHFLCDQQDISSVIQDLNYVECVREMHMNPFFYTSNHLRRFLKLVGFCLSIFTQRIAQGLNLNQIPSSKMVAHALPNVANCVIFLFIYSNLQDLATTPFHTETV